MRLRHIELFHALMRTGSVSAAARLLHITQPAATRMLQHAEAQLGFALFTRMRGRLEPTQEAGALYPQVEQLVMQLDAVQRLSVQLRAGRDAPTLRVLSVMALTQELLPRAVLDLRERHPALQLRIEALHTPQIVSSLLLREADVGLAFNAAPHPGLAQEALGECPMVCVAPRGWLPPAVREARQVSLAQLGGLPLVALDAQDPVGVRLGQACREAGVGLRTVLTVQTYHAALAMAQHGLGIALIDGCTALSADRARVDVLRLVPLLPVTLHALRPMQGGHESVAVRSLLQTLRQTLSRSLQE